jgi:hypothetical protein
MALAQPSEIAQRLTHRVGWGGADVAIDDAERGNRQARSSAQGQIAVLPERI